MIATCFSCELCAINPNFVGQRPQALILKLISNSNQPNKNAKLDEFRCTSTLKPRIFCLKALSPCLEAVLWQGAAQGGAYPKPAPIHDHSDKELVLGIWKVQCRGYQGYQGQVNAGE